MVDHERVLARIGNSVDAAYDVRDAPSLEVLRAELAALARESFSPALRRAYHYTVANAAADLHEITRGNSVESWNWEQPLVGESILHLRLAAQGELHDADARNQACNVLTNLGNQLSHIGRFVEALAPRRRALEIDPTFSMARANNAQTLLYYANYLHDSGHQAIFMKIAHDEISLALKNPEQFQGGAEAFFRTTQGALRGRLSPQARDAPLPLPEHSLGATQEEKTYREWALRRRLFLNPLNDAILHSIAANDVHSLPGITVTAEKGMGSLGFYNQLKQEYAAARFFHFEGATAVTAHWADRDVRLINTLDYPSYGIATEKLRVAFRMSYSLFDKIAFFLNNYFELAHAERDVSFRRVWYLDANPKKELHPAFQSRQNLPLRGLHWLAKDLYERDPRAANALEPDAKDLADVRQHLEHKYLKVLDSQLHTLARDRMGPMDDPLAKKLTRAELERKSLKLLELARAALIHLTMAIVVEEHERNHLKPGRTISLDVDTWDDEWKC